MGFIYEARKRPIVVEVMKFDNRAGEIADWCGGRVVSDMAVEISTLEGVMTARFGDWVIKGTEGEFYPCKPTVFAETYTIISRGSNAPTRT